jgi:hypothetical protein
MTLSYLVVLRWRPGSLSTAADQLRRQIGLLEELAERVRATQRTTAGHWHGAAADSAQCRLGRSVATAEELLASLENARARLDGAAGCLGDAQSRVRVVVDDAEASDFRVTPDGAVHPPFLPPPGLAPPSMGDLADYVASFDARSRRLLDQAAERTEQLRVALREARLADEHHAATLRHLLLPPTLLVEELRVEQQVPAAWTRSRNTVAFPTDWQPWPAMSRGSDGAWARMVLLGACMPGAVLGAHDDADDGGTGYYGGGFVTGPDGRRYPLVVPQVLRSGALHRTNADFGDPLVEDLAGTDHGWHQVGSNRGIGRFGEPMALAEKLVIGVAAGSGGAPGTGTGLRRRNDRLPGLRTDGLGSASVTTPGAARTRTPGRVEEDPRALPPDPPGVHTDRAELVGGAVTLVADAAAAAVLVEHLDDNLTHGYTLALQQNEDGRRRALLDLYDVYDTDDGHLVVQRHLGYVDTDGRLALADAAPLSTGAAVGPGPGA